MMHTKAIYQFDDVTVDPASFQVTKAGNAVSLEPKAFEVLIFLISNPGRLIEKEELLNVVWKDAFVTQNAMTRVIAQLRKALGDDAKQAKYIETVPTRGYRFVTEIRSSEGHSVLKEGGDSATQVMGRSRSLSWATMSPWTKRLVLSFVIVIAVVGSRIYWNRASADVPAIKRTLQLTNWTGLDIYPAPSPDGNYVAYSSDHNGGFEIYVKQLTPGAVEIQLTSDGGQNYQPVWSPDGRFISYYNKTRGGIWVVPSHGGTARQLTDFGSRPAWSPDGSTIVFQSDGLNDVGATAYGAMSPSRLWLVASQGGKPRQITQMNNPKGGHGSPSWSPDGKRIVFATYGVGNIQICSVKTNGEDVKSLYKGYAFDPIYAPDGESIFFAGEINAITFSILKLRVNPYTGDAIGRPVEVKSSGTSLPKHLRFSADGKKLFYTLLWMTNNLWSVPLSSTSSEATGQPIPFTQDTTYRKTMPVFSPDGSKLYYVADRSGENVSVIITDPSGKNTKELLPEEGFGPLAGWFPDGAHIAALTGDNHRTSLSSIAIDGGRINDLVEMSDVTSWPRLSPDGKYIAYHSEGDGAVNIKVTPTAGVYARQVTFGQELIGFPCWSPDARFLGVEIKHGEDSNVGIIPVNSGEFGQVIQLTFDKGQSWGNSWSPDGDKIVFAGQRNAVWNIWWVSKSTKVQKQLTNYSKQNTFVRYPAWSPRGDQIVYEMAETTGNIWMTEFK